MVSNKLKNRKKHTAVASGAIKNSGYQNTDSRGPVRWQQITALVFTILAGMIALACVVLCIATEQMVWTVVFWLFIVAVVYLAKKQIEMLGSQIHDKK